MGTKGLQRLAILLTKNADPAWINQDLYQLLWHKEIYTAAWQRWRQSKVSEAPDTYGSFGMGSIDLEVTSIIGEMRRQEITLGKLEENLTTPHFSREILIREVLSIILAAIYQSPQGATFKESVHGWRIGTGRHSALRVVGSWQNVKRLVYGSVAGTVQREQQHVLMTLLQQRIDDGRFLDLIWKTLAVWPLDFTATVVDSFAATLLGVYLHPLDCLMAAISSCQEGQGGAAAQKSPVYYVRYANEWLIGECGDKPTLAMPNQVKQLLMEQLKFNDKTFTLRQARTHGTNFLGYQVTASHRIAATPFSSLRLHAPIQRIIALLAREGICDGSGRPEPNSAWVRLEPVQIVTFFNRILQGYLEYYSFADNRPQLRHVQYILQHSAALILAWKLRLSVRKVFQRFGPNLAVTPSASLVLNQNWRPARRVLPQQDAHVVDSRWIPL